MHSRDVPIILVRPDERSYPLVSLGTHDSDLERVSKDFFRTLGVGSAEFVESAVPNGDYHCYWSGTVDEIEYEVMRAQGAHAVEYPFWILVGLNGRAGWSDMLVEQAYALSDRLARAGWRCLVRGFIPATAEAPL